MPTKSRAKTVIDAPVSVLALIPLNRLNELICAKRRVTADTALRLAKLLDTSAEWAVHN